MTLDKIVKVFNKTLTQLEKFIEKKGEEIEFYNAAMNKVESQKKQAEADQMKAANIRDNINKIIG